MLCTTNEMTKSCKILIYKIFGNSLPQDFFHMSHTSYESIKYVITILQHTEKRMSSKKISIFHKVFAYNLYTLTNVCCSLTVEVFVGQPHRHPLQ